jgi:sugar phosphate isomerase/epimerase
MRISILSYSFRGLLDEGKMDVFGYLETCKYRYNLSAVDIWSGFFPNTDEDFINKLKDGLDERDMVLADLCVDGAHVWEDDPYAREKNHQRALEFLKIADVLESKFVRIDAGGGNEMWTDEQFEFIVNRYREYSQFAHDHGFKMGLENHWGPERSWTNLKKVYEAVNHPGFGVSCHLGGWSGSQKEVTEADQLASPWVCHTHISWDICSGSLMEKLKNLWDVGYQGYYSVEHHIAKNEYQNVAIQLAQVREVLERLRKDEIV